MMREDCNGVVAGYPLAESQVLGHQTINTLVYKPSGIGLNMR